MIDGHGDDLFRFKGLVKHNFSSNIFSRVNHDGLLAHLAECGEDMLHYPEPRCKSLEHVLADEAGVDSSHVLVTNGATECIYMIAQMMRGKKAAIVAPAFREYEDACELNDMEVLWFGSLADAVQSGADVVWVCNPANPTGYVTPHDELLCAINKYANTLFVVDQAYADYTLLRVLTPQECVACGNVIMLSSLTKRFAVPGLRIGYAIGQVDEVAKYLRPWSVNSVAIAAAHYLVEHKADYMIDAQMLHEEALRIGNELEKINIKVMRSDCNFILCELPHGSAAELKHWLVERHGILIRDASNFHGLDRRYLRVAAQTKEENNLLINALTQWIGL
ncbi:MAG: aminotransferase class I/II-fold pyridoxal phosphate-dependent enzyme [Paramuribaculum sp.]|nr:aminotransferase class I/II-fold pyridoxal phosphate-dependent enzyme [Paramuribaculum sp.]